MGMHFGLIAARVSVAELQDAFLAALPKYEVVGTSGPLSDADALDRWAAANARFVLAADWSETNKGREIYQLWRDGPWAVLWEQSAIHATDEKLVAALSERLGPTLGLFVESSGGCGGFVFADGGVVKRRVFNSDGDVEIAGEPIPQEAGINASAFYMQEAEALARALGLSLGGETAVDFHAVCIVDHTDYSRLSSPFGTKPTPPAPPPRKRWWQFWS